MAVIIKFVVLLNISSSIHINILDRDMTLGRVGAPCTNCDLKLVSWEEGNYRVTDKPHPRGEIILGGENISVGYYKNPEKTKEDFYVEDGKRWFKTGDICEIHEDGVVKIIGEFLDVLFNILHCFYFQLFCLIDRKKDLVKLQAGEYVSLGKVEAELKTCPLVDNICVYGESSKDFCVALVVPNQQHLKDLAEKKGIKEKSFEQLCVDPQIEKAVKQELADHGKKSE